MAKLSPYQQTLRVVIDTCGRAHPEQRLLFPGHLYNWAYRHMDKALRTSPGYRSMHALGDKGKAWECMGREVAAVNPHYVEPLPVEALFPPGTLVWDSGDRAVYRVLSTDKEGWVSLSWSPSYDHTHRTRKQRHLRKLVDQRAGLGTYLASNPDPALEG